MTTRSGGLLHHPAALNQATGKDKAKVRVRELEAQLERAKDRNRTLEELVVTQGKCLALHVDVSVHGSANSPRI